jgi:hypothetical protein
MIVVQLLSDIDRINLMERFSAASVNGLGQKRGLVITHTGTNSYPWLDYF